MSRTNKIIWLGVAIASIAGIALASTTISTNVVTGGDLNVSGTSTLNNLIATGTTTLSGTTILNGGLQATVIPLEGTSATLAGVVPLSGQAVYETNTRYYKIGDGVTSVGNTFPLNFSNNGNIASPGWGIGTTTNLDALLKIAGGSYSGTPRSADQIGLENDFIGDDVGETYNVYGAKFSVNADDANNIYGVGIDVIAPNISGGEDAGLYVSDHSAGSATSLIRIDGINSSSTATGILLSNLTTGIIANGIDTLNHGTSGVMGSFQNVASTEDKNTHGGYALETKGDNYFQAFIINGGGKGRGFTGIGTSSPSSVLSVSEEISTTSVPLFTVASSSNAILFQVNYDGHKVTGGASPTCGTGCSSVTGDDNTMRVVTGSSVSSATVNFAHTYTKTPVCIANEESGGTVGVNASSTPSAVIVNFASSLTTVKIAIICQISQNFTQ